MHGHFSVEMYASEKKIKKFKVRICCYVIVICRKLYCVHGRSGDQRSWEYTERQKCSNSRGGTFYNVNVWVWRTQLRTLLIIFVLSHGNLMNCSSNKLAQETFYELWIIQKYKCIIIITIIMRYWLNTISNI